MPRTPRDLAVATSGTDEVEGINVTPSDTRFMVAFLKNFKSKPDIDWDGLVTAIGTTNRKSAAQRWLMIRQKFGIHFDESAKGAVTTRPTPTTPASNRKRTLSAKRNTIEDDSDASLPPSVRRELNHELKNLDVDHRQQDLGSPVRPRRDKITIKLKRGKNSSTTSTSGIKRPAEESFNASGSSDNYLPSVSETDGEGEEDKPEVKKVKREVFSTPQTPAQTRRQASKAVSDLGEI
ncbi:uncharacterized protein C8A04DRAFT_28216 [Dichotomopilus funicola]|uniref:Uncharacterized protein n=1 Tax=Dichotomopilus funicola TaxID=1934379 RepID=A0AAN6ZMN5_9PEZI|nr:hypothetical protein C8A04DRAFT_28216 [Dichotomopilus funicola]